MYEIAIVCQHPTKFYGVYLEQDLSHGAPFTNMN